MPQISVIIPVYNRKSMLLRALHSVINQSYSDLEVIVIDDCSTDGTAELALTDIDTRIKFYHQQFRSGVSKARNDGVRCSQGKWLAFLDSDDEWLNTKLERQMQWFAIHSDYEIMQTREIWIRKGVRVNAPKTHEKVGGDLFCTSLDRCMITPSSVLLTRSLFDRVGGFNESFPACEDYDLWLRICQNHLVGLIDEQLLIRYGGHCDQLSSSIPGLDRFRIRSIINLLEHNTLNKVQRPLAIATLLKKATIVANGYLKRGNIELHERYSSIIRKYC